MFVFLICTAIAVLALMQMLSYTGICFLAPVVVAFFLISFSRFAVEITLMIIGSKVNKTVVKSFFGSLVALSILVLSNPLDYMSKEEKANLPCKGYVDPAFDDMVEGFPEWGSQECTSVVHIGHGFSTEKDSYFMHEGDIKSVKEIVSLYEEKKHFVFSCRGELGGQNLIDVLLNFKINTYLSEKEVEKQNDKEVHFFAKKGNLLVRIKILHWIIW